MFKSQFQTGGVMAGVMDGKTWWITGASSGIGQALAERLGQLGANLVVSGRNRAALEDLAGRVGVPTLVLPFEATDYTRLPECVEAAWAWAAASTSGCW